MMQKIMEITGLLSSDDAVSEEGYFKVVTVFDR